MAPGKVSGKRRAKANDTGRSHPLLVGRSRRAFGNVQICVPDPGMERLTTCWDVRDPSNLVCPTWTWNSVVPVLTEAGALDAEPRPVF